MAILTKAQLEALNQSSFPDNSTEAITPEILRTYNTATIDSLVDSLDTGSFTTDAEFNAFTSSVNAKFATIGSQSGSWGGGGSGSIVGYATTGSNTFVGNQTIQTDGTLNGILYKTGSSEFFVGQRSNGNFAISSSADSRIIDINPQSGWVEHYTQNNFNGGVSTRGLLDVRNITTQTGNGFVAQFDNFTASLQEGYAWVGKSGGTSIAVPTSSFSGGGGGTIVGYATTGSNTFTGSQFINGGNKLFIQRDTQGAQQYLRLGATDNTYNFAFIVTGSDTNPGQQVWGINTAGGIWANSFDAGVVFNSYVTASSGINISNGTFSAPLQQGYVWVGNASGRTTTVPTSSFGGGGSTFPYTGDAQITGSLGVSSNITASGEIRTDSRMYVFNQYGGIDIQQNAQGSGSQYPGMSMKVAPNTYPTDIFGGFSVLTEQGAIAGTTFLGLVANSYSTQYNGTTVPMIIANGNNPAGNDTALIWKSDGTAEHWKKSDFKYGIDVTGSVRLTPASTSTNAAYPIPFISGSTISKDSVDTLTYNPSSNTLRLTGSVIGNKISAFDFDTLFLGTQLAGSTANGTFNGFGSSTYEFVVGAYSGAFDNELKITANSSGITFGDFNGSSYPTWLRLSPNAGSNPAPQFTRGLQITGSLGVSGATTLNNNVTITGSLNQRGGNTQLLGNLNVSGAYLTVDSPGGTGITINNGGLNSAGTIVAQNGVNSSGQVNILSGAGLSIQANLQGSGSAYSIAGAFVDNTSDPTNVYSAFQLVDADTFKTLAMAWNSYTPYYSTSTPMIAGADQYNGSDVIFGFPTNVIDVWKPAKFKAEATFTTGSNKQAGTATLNGGNPGTVTVSNSLVTANSIIMLTKQSLGNTHSVAVTAKSAGSFTITSTGNGDSDVVGWFIINNS